MVDEKEEEEENTSEREIMETDTTTHRKDSRTVDYFVDRTKCMTKIMNGNYDTTRHYTTLPYTHYYSMEGMGIVRLIELQTAIQYDTLPEIIIHI